MPSKCICPFCGYPRDCGDTWCPTCGTDEAEVCTDGVHCDLNSSVED